MRPFGLMLALLSLVAVPAAAQIPDEFTNLKIFPEDIGKRELISVMREFAGALGVRCNHCHKGPGNLEGMDFATDDLEPKRVARAMMKVTQEINDKLLPTIGRESLLRVRCVTCHRGITRPEQLDDILDAAYSHIMLGQLYMQKGDKEAAVASMQPWYSYVAPVSWWVADHVHHGRGDLNFSQWPVLDLEELEHSFHDIDEQIAKGEMPLKSYLILHPEARLSEEDRAALRRWARSNF